MAPLVSIVTVTRNDVLGLQATGKSVAAQSDNNFEWIVADGASTDETAAVMNNWNDCPVIFTSKADSSIYEGMNNGAAKSSGQWLYFLNAGDVFSESTSLAHMRNLLTETTCDWGFAAVRQVRPDGTGFAMHSASPYNQLGLALGNTTIPHQGTFVRREVFNQLGGFLVDFGTEADQEFIYRVSLTGSPFEEVWPIADMRMGGTGWNGATGHLVRAMHRARKLSGQRVGGNALTDALATFGVLTSAYLEAFEGWAAARLAR